MPVLQQDETLTASTEVNATADEVYAVISDVTRIPQWSPETVRVQWLDPGLRFRARNRRRLARWSTDAKVVAAEHGREFSFVVQALGGDWTQWTYLIAPGPAGTTRLTEQFRMCVRLPFGILVYEYLFLFVRDRRSDLQANLQTSVDRIRNIVESAARQELS